MFLAEELLESNRKHSLWQSLNDGSIKELMKGREESHFPTVFLTTFPWVCYRLRIENMVYSEEICPLILSTMMR
ncbi:hypothetical protein ATG66_1190 [Vibrio sp. ES.051]|nr:hypothetical protein ATG66_1190 [Vibrio sp. ES.051]